jgi:hypothetical protein
MRSTELLRNIAYIETTVPLADYASAFVDLLRTCAEKSDKVELTEKQFTCFIELLKKADRKVGIKVITPPHSRPIPEKWRTWIPSPSRH